MDKPQEKAKTGRPTLYDPAMCGEAEVYISKCQDEWDEFHKTRGDKSDTYERTLVVNLPKLEAFARHLHVSYDTVMEWARVYPDFRKALDLIKEAQKERLMDKSLAGSYNSTIAKLILSANHGMNEKTETIVTNLPQPILDTTEPENDVPENNGNNQDTSAA